MSKHYIVPLDGSALSEGALPWARRLAELQEADLLLIRTLPAPLDDQEKRQEIVDYLQRKSGEFPKGMSRFDVRDGDPAEAILELSEVEGATGVIMASHGRGGLGRWLLGSVATKVVRGSTLPVFVVNAQTDIQPTPRLDRILVPLDGSPLSEKALPMALQLAEAADARVIIYRSIVPGGLEYPTMDQAIAAGRQTVEHYLGEVAYPYPASLVETVATFDHPAEGIAKLADTCDLIVMASHGRSGVRRWVLGSVAERIIQVAKCPVLLVYDR